MVTVVVASYGDEEWRALAARAISSARHQAPVVAVHLPDGTLAQARNAGLDQVETEFVVFLDADDELEPGYIDAMLAGTADIRAPRVRPMRPGVVRTGAFMPKVWSHRRRCPTGCSADCLPDGNWLVIGACARTELLRDLGGFREEPVYEDWSLWLRCQQAGASFEPIQRAVYRQHLSPGSRNHVMAHEEREAWHYRIVEAACSTS